MRPSTNIVWPTGKLTFTGRLPAKVSALFPDHTTWSLEKGARPSAVLILFCPPEEGGAPADVVLTRRSVHVRTHKGQISLVGGRREDEDATPQDTAMREAIEELGIPPTHLVTAGAIPALKGMDGQAILPILAYTDLRPEAFSADPGEVAEVFTVPWTLLTRDHASSFRFNLFGRWRQSELYMTPHGGVWGITAHILKIADLASEKD